MSKFSVFILSVLGWGLGGNMKQLLQLSCGFHQNETETHIGDKKALKALRTYYLMSANIEIPNAQIQIQIQYCTDIQIHQNPIPNSRTVCFRKQIDIDRQMEDGMYSYVILTYSKKYAYHTWRNVKDLHSVKIEPSFVLSKIVDSGADEIITHVDSNIGYEKASSNFLTTPHTHPLNDTIWMEKKLCSMCQSSLKYEHSTNRNNFGHTTGHYCLPKNYSNNNNQT